MSKNTETATREWVNETLKGANIPKQYQKDIGTAFTKLAKDLAATKGFNPDHMQDYQLNDN